MTISRVLLLVVVAPVAAACATASPELAATKPGAPMVVRGSNGVVVSSSLVASEVGVAIMKAGGNAVDAAVATALALAVTYPPAGNIGGGGMMLVRPAEGQGEPMVVDYRERAPAAAHATMFSRTDSQYAHRAVAIPGTMRGLELAHRRWGRLAWAALVAPAVALARDGFAIDDNLATKTNEVFTTAPLPAEFKRIYGPRASGPWRAGDRWVMPELAKTLALLAEAGPDAFYKGPIAEGILAEMARGGGILTAADLADYQALLRQPLRTSYRGRWEILVPPPPSSGGVVIIETLHALETLDVARWPRMSAPMLHHLAEIFRRTSYDRARFLGDPAFVRLPETLLSREYGRGLAASIDPERATRSDALSKDIPLTPESQDTTHFSVVDASGMAVANTYTLERRWGSRIVVGGMGFLLNNDMWAFNLFPGETDRKGAIGTDANTIAPGKRPLTSMTPTMVLEQGRVRLVTGSPGSRAIPHTIVQVIVNTLDYQLPLDQAVGLPRLSHQWFPDQITFEAPDTMPELAAALRGKGHTVVKSGPLPQGSAHSIWIPSVGPFVGVADMRISGGAASF